MKIINRKAFLEIPHEVLFSKYEPGHFGDILIKSKDCFIFPTQRFNDFEFFSIGDAFDYPDGEEHFDVLFKAQETGESMPMNFYIEDRDAMFDDDQLFAVWEKQDVLSLIDRLKEVAENMPEYEINR